MSELPQMPDIPGLPKPMPSLGGNLRPHFPGFIETDEPRIVSKFSTMEGLTTIPFVKRWCQSPEFHALARGSGDLLMAVLKNGNFYVIGYIDPPTGLEALPHYKDVLAAMGKPRD